MFAWTFVGTLLAAVAAFFLFSGFIRIFRLYRGTRVITCPENGRHAAVRVAAWDAATLFALSGEPDLHLRSCTRWPEMAGCAEDCLKEVQTSPEACLVQTIVASWYEGKHCHFCRKPVGEIAWHERPPALRMPDGTTREWKDVRREELPSVFVAAEPVCWSCNLIETFRREHRSMVVERVRVAAPQHTIAPSVAVY